VKNEGALNQAQQQFGLPHPAIEKKIQSYMDPVVQEFIRSAPFVVMATSNVDGDCDASPRGGLPGFVRIIDEHTLLLPDLSGNKLFQSYQNIETNPKVGLIFMIPGCGLTVRANGRAAVMDHDELAGSKIEPEVFAPDERTAVLQALRITIDEVYPHCPRAFRFSGLWDVETIRTNSEMKSDRYWYEQWAKSGQ
jgi:PPOX class probable FMN-dependent enzyme